MKFRHTIHTGEESSSPSNNKVVKKDNSKPPAPKKQYISYNTDGLYSKVEIRNPDLQALYQIAGRNNQWRVISRSKFVMCKVSLFHL